VSISLELCCQRILKPISFAQKSPHGPVDSTHCSIHRTPKTIFPSLHPSPSISPPRGPPFTLIYNCWCFSSLLACISASALSPITTSSSSSTVLPVFTLRYVKFCRFVKVSPQIFY